MDQAYKKEQDIRLKRMQEAGIPGKNPFRSWRRDLERKLRLESEAIDDLAESYQYCQASM
ncbi:MAG TPA: hypothetical protein PKN56_17460 [Leptospiraceae bacterium]|nr:hypothetical protein [Leptospiraceae bacterium]